MSGVIWLDWAVLAVSLYNTIQLFWLGLTILLNAEQRHGGIWLAGGGLLTGAAFFLSHSAILGLGLQGDPAVNFWWRLGWILVILAPFGWYVVMLWYTGYWEGRSNPVYRRQRFWFWLLALATAVMVSVSLTANPLPGIGQLALFELSAFQPSPEAYVLALVRSVEFFMRCPNRRSSVSNSSCMARMRNGGSTSFVKTA